jgi:hypothetical protein
MQIDSIVSTGPGRYETDVTVPQGDHGTITTETLKIRYLERPLASTILAFGWYIARLASIFLVSQNPPEI